MRRPAAWLMAAGLACSTILAAQHAPEGKREAEGREAAEHPAKGEHGSMEVWKWANFVLLAGVLGYMIGKNAGPFFAARSQQIRRGMAEAGEMRREAEERVAQVDARLANLGSEIEALRRESREQEQAEAERMRAQTAAEMAKIRSHAEQEIESAGKSARLELKRHSAELALGLAEEKIRTRMTPETEGALVEGFVREVAQPAGGPQSS